jgi:molybdopterin molybdotransferase
MNVDAAVAHMLADFARLPAESIPLIETLGRTLAHDIRADISLPPFANSSMDGYAIRAADAAASDARLRVTMDIPAGASIPERALQPGEAARIMTGAPIPPGADAVVPMEVTDQPWDAGEILPLPESVTIRRAFQTGNNVRPVGEDIAAGDVVLHAGALIRPAEMGMLAALGMSSVAVVRRPRVGIISTGDELADVDEPLSAGKIRDSNSYTLAGLVTSYGGEPIRTPIARDTLDEVRARFHAVLDAGADVVLSSAGVSVGAFDVVKVVLSELGEVGFWRVNLRPGKPLAYGKLRVERGAVPFFGLPGNPVSAMVTFDVFVRPALLKLTGRPDAVPTIRAVTTEALRSDGRRSYLRVIIVKREESRVFVSTTGTQSSGALSSMVRADGLMIVPEGMTDIPAGTELPVRLLRPFE